MKTGSHLGPFVLAGLMLAFTLQLTAQDPDGGQGRPGGPGRGPQMTEEDIKERVDNLAETLKMSEDQHKKILAVDMEFYNKMQIERQKMRNDGGPPPDREAMRAKMREMRDERNQKYEDVLTPEQYDKFIEIQERRREQMRQQHQQNNPGGEEDRPPRGRGRN
ncbi:MAG: hypothetical protein KAT15_16845 [Bacteroidales bacterium]|nr:hypothetical protein [Bacteroidales bacterium]